MDASAIAAAFAASQAAQTQLALATQFVKAKAQSDAAIATILEQATRDVANLAAGIGQNVDKVA